MDVSDHENGVDLGDSVIVINDDVVVSVDEGIIEEIGADIEVKG